MIAGLAGDAGKTIVALGLILAVRRAGIAVRAFKKGPDYIDAAWLSWAAGHTARNLDSFLMGFDGARVSFTRHATPGGLNVIEGNRGLYDGLDASGTHSTAELAKSLSANVVLVVDATKVSRTTAAMVLGCQRLDPAAHIAGVVLNRTRGPRHDGVIREAIETACGVPVVGAIPRIENERLLPSRHLGLVPPDEHRAVSDDLLHAVGDHLDLDALLALARDAEPLSAAAEAPPAPAAGRRVKVGYLRDSAFSFYYPENLEALERNGADLAPLSALSGNPLPPDLDALYIGGGFPETHAAELAANRALLASLRDSRIPVYAECGGMMLLAQAISWNGREFPMAGVLPLRVEMCRVAQGHGYAVLAVDRPNPFFPVGTELRGHEFHYSRIVPGTGPLPTACSVVRGTGCYQGREGIVQGNVWASYVHLHALGAPDWAAGFIKVARS